MSAVFTYPLTFNSYEEHAKHIADNSCWYDYELSKHDLDKTSARGVAVRSDTSRLPCPEMIADLRRKESELSRIQEELKEKQNLVDLYVKRGSSVGSSIKGLCQEEWIKSIFKSSICVGTEWSVQSCRGAHQMDIRLTDKADRVIGIECKDKKSCTSGDVNKFIQDKVRNDFYRSIFLSTCPIPRVLLTENTCTLRGNNLFIFTTDQNYLTAAVKMYIAHLPSSDDPLPTQDAEKLANSIETLQSMYTHWHDSKLATQKFDDIFIAGMNSVGATYQKSFHLSIGRKTTLEGTTRKKKEPIPSTDDETTTD